MAAGKGISELVVVSILILVGLSVGTAFYFFSQGSVDQLGDIADESLESERVTGRSSLYIEEVTSKSSSIRIETTGASDPDIGDEIYLYVCKVASASPSGCTPAVDTWCQNTTPGINGDIMCDIDISGETPGVKNYFVYVYDSNNAPAGLNGDPGTFTVPALTLGHVRVEGAYGTLDEIFVNNTYMPICI